jgi:hypothetical protein
MKRQELIKELKQRGIQYKATLKTEELQALYDQSELKVQTVVDDITGKSKMTADEIVQGAERTEDGAKRKSGIIVPNQVLAQMSRTQYRYVADCTENACQIRKVDHRGQEQEVRVYSRDRHGDNFKDLADQFITKFNKKQ